LYARVIYQKEKKTHSKREEAHIQPMRGKHTDPWAHLFGATTRHMHQGPLVSNPSEGENKWRW
ncbi:hypothetical protein BAE44_0026273, partial [Dichanthelium oligosanthes]